MAEESVSSTVSTTSADQLSERLGSVTVNDNSKQVDVSKRLKNLRKRLAQIDSLRMSTVSTRHCLSRVLNDYPCQLNFKYDFLLDIKSTMILRLISYVNNTRGN